MNMVGSRARGGGERIHDHLMSMRIFTLIMNKVAMCKNYAESGSNLDLNLLTVLY